ncbi:hypothetical protein [Minisyncoccus archaeiphilus]|uniref:hypothetical protein n=1 Tax=Minisyncoccus archaeiphilus TaxID=3238481 RepID=UPI00399CF23D
MELVFTMKGMIKITKISLVSITILIQGYLKTISTAILPGLMMRGLIPTLMALSLPVVVFLLVILLI